MKILLVNPPIYDFSAFDFWLKPYGLLRIGGSLRGRVELHLFDFLDRLHPESESRPRDAWGRGKFMSRIVEKPAALRDVPRHYRRYGLPTECFRKCLADNGPFDFALIQTSMTYWYPGVAEVLRTLERDAPQTRTVLGGVYASICPRHARALGADLVIEGDHLGPLWELLGVVGDSNQPPLWEAYPALETGVLKLTMGCPFRCTYCSVPRFQPEFRPGSMEDAVSASKLLSRLGARQIVFYDDALLFKPEALLFPFLDAIVPQASGASFHTPNALNARFVTDEVAKRFRESGFRFLFLGFESDSMLWQRRTGGKVYPNELDRAVNCLSRAGFDLDFVTCYLIVGHPHIADQAIEHSLRFAHSLGLKTMLSEFSPIPGTPDGEACRELVDLDEPLNHNKTAFTHRLLGGERLQALKNLANELNHSLSSGAKKPGAPSETG